MCLETLFFPTLTDFNVLGKSNFIKQGIDFFKTVLGNVMADEKYGHYFENFQVNEHVN